MRVLRMDRGLKAGEQEVRCLPGPKAMLPCDEALNAWGQLQGKRLRSAPDFCGAPEGPLNPRSLMFAWRAEAIGQNRA